MSKALYRKYRSKSLDEIVGQNHVTDILRRSLSAGRIAHAYLLTGPRGVGKTSIARILAHEINQLPYNEDAVNLDIIEIDAASNNGVEDVRDLREKVQIAPVSAQKKVYIIDEVHMLSKQAFNALLKTLEEPPSHIVFILATTDVDKLPATIISRTQQFHFRSIDTVDAVKHLKTIATAEKINIHDEALTLIAERSEGSFRDSISLLDQMQSLLDSQTQITRKDIEQSLGLAPNQLITDLLDAYESKDLQALVTLLQASDRNGVQPTTITHQLINATRQRLVEKPIYIQLLDQLLDVAKSSQPSIKLLTTLAAHAVVKPKSAALSAPAPVISAPIAELERQATKAIPKIVPQKPVIPPVEKPSDTEQASETPPPALPPTSQPVDWDALIEYTKNNYVAIYSVLKKCSYEHTDAGLILYAGSAFWKRKLDDAKYRIHLLDALRQTGVGDLEITTYGTPPPPKDSTAAAVAAIMGGGEEVSVSE